MAHRSTWKELVGNLPEGVSAVWVETETGALLVQTKVDTPVQFTRWSVINRDGMVIGRDETGNNATTVRNAQTWAKRRAEESLHAIIFGREVRNESRPPNAAEHQALTWALLQIGLRQNGQWNPAQRSVIAVMRGAMLEAAITLGPEHPVGQKLIDALALTPDLLLVKDIPEGRPFTLPPLEDQDSYARYRRVVTAPEPRTKANCEEYVGMELPPSNATENWSSDWVPPLTVALLNDWSEANDEEP